MVPKGREFIVKKLKKKRKKEHTNEPYDLCNAYTYRKQICKNNINNNSSSGSDSINNGKDYKIDDEEMKRMNE